MLKVSSSRRTASLKPGDFDHEIGIVDHDGDAEEVAPSPDLTGMSRISTTAQLLPHAEEPGHDDSGEGPAPVADGDGNEGLQVQERPPEELQQEQELPHPALRPSIEVQGAFQQQHSEHQLAKSMLCLTLLSP